jgi:hypothetical protein
VTLGGGGERATCVPDAPRRRETRYLKVGARQAAHLLAHGRLEVEPVAY